MIIKHVQHIFIAALIILNILFVLEAARKNGRGSNSRLRRKTIIKCCGTESCFRMGSKRVTVTTMLTRTNITTTSSKTTSLLPSEPFTEVSELSSAVALTSPSKETTEAITELVQETSTERMTEPITTVFTEPPRIEPTTTESTTTESTTTESTTTESTTTESTTSSSSTTTSTTTTTKPPTQEELIRGVCTSYDTDPALFATENAVKDPKKYGFWVQSCGQQFLLGKNLATWRENLINCSRIGMAPLTFESPAKLECFRNMVSKWKFNANYWTSGLRFNDRNFGWCVKNDTVLMDGVNLPWAAGNPDNRNGTENCLHLKVNRTRADFLFSNRICTSLQFLACQGQPTPAPPGCSAPACPNITCAKNMSIHVTIGYRDFLYRPFRHGTWFQEHLRTYMFSFPNNTQTFAGAIQACCEFGLQLLSLESVYKYQSLIKAIKVNTSDSDFFWTSGSDQGCEGKFGWCNVPQWRVNKSAPWASGQPDNAQGNENAVAIFLNKTHAQLFDFNEQKKFRFICESRQTYGIPSPGAMVRDECGSVYKWNQSEIDRLLSDTIIQMTAPNSKPFVTCVAEKSDLMVNGEFVENEVLAVMENQAGENRNELQSNINIVRDDCGSSTAGMNDTDKASKMFSCVGEKAPAVLTGVVAGMDQALPPLENDPMPPDAFCFNEHTNCTVDPVLKAEIDACKSTCAVASGDVEVICGKKFYQFKPIVVMEEAFKQCCIRGMKLASIATLEEKLCLANMTLSEAPVWMWVAISRINSTRARWCTSPEPFSLKDYVWKNDNADLLLDAYVVAPKLNIITISKRSNFHSPLCVLE
ncbi:uncharacterized protein LOC132205048 isoform X2 [Neocloeon triangulifer]|uniref:uncharacterized protein LOC132205048 isoform X2 n=1 Tax=Neocloeon triangulifer TaxID=2078957 RepID=UPI00286EEBEE|nr:uncharacterized protein LOC132205048 isoform X2 [Neocloeon triangulifer]